MIAVAYLRVSGQGQLDGDGFPRQAEVVERFAALHGHTIVNVFFEDFTGKAEDRPAFNAMLEWCATNDVAIVLVENMERFSRKFSTGEFLVSACQARHLKVYECTSGDELTDDDPNPDVWLRGAFKMLMAEYDRRKIVHRTRTARLRIRNSGRKCEGRKGCKELNPQAVARIWQLHEQLGNKPTAIASQLNSEGVPSISGKPWKSGTVHGIISKGRA